MNFAALLLGAMFSGLSLGYVKFYFLGVLSYEYYTPADKSWIIQTLGAIITLGPTLAFVFASPIASSFYKARIMRWCGLAAGAFMLLGYTSGWLGSGWLYVLGCGFVMGIFNPAKNAAVPLQADQAGRSTEFVNAMLGIVYILGILSGAPLATELYLSHPQAGAVLGALLFISAGIFGGLCSYQKERDHLRELRQASRDLIKDTWALFRSYPDFIIAPTMIWGMASATSLGITAYAEEMKLGDAVKCSFMAAYPVVGVMLGAVLSARLTKVRYLVSSVCALLMVWVVYSIPLLVRLVNPSSVVAENGFAYWALASYLGFLGFLFGLTTNLLESEYLRLVYRERKEGAGAAILSAMTALFPTLFGGVIALAVLQGWASSETQFTWLAVLTAIAAILILRLGMRRGSGRASLQKCIALLFRQALALRYSVTVRGLENLPAGTSGVLVLPNHPAEIDPVIVSAQLWRWWTLRPVVLEKYYYLPGVHQILKFINAIPMPDMDFEAGPFKRRRVEKALAAVVTALKNGENVLMYPSGRLMPAGVERMSGTSGVAWLLKEYPEVPIALVRTRGLFGSSFSKAVTGGQSPDFQKAVAAALRTLLRNLVFFAPRRPVNVAVCFQPKDFPRQAEPLLVNHFLEEWYNQLGEEPISLVSRSFWRQDIPEIPPVPREEELLRQISPEVEQKVLKKISQACGVPVAEITASQELGDDLGIDSLALAELLVWLNHEFDAHDVDLGELTTVASMLRVASGQGMSGARVSEEPAPPFWSSDQSLRPPPLIPQATTLGAAFLESIRRMRPYPALADSRSGVLSGARAELGVFLLSRRIAALPGERIGLLFPASVAGSLAVLACVLARKTPVLLNWTSGQRSLEHAIAVSGLQCILSARGFLDMIQVDFAFLEDRLVFMEDIRKEISLRSTLAAKLQLLQSSTRLSRQLGLDTVKPDDPAVILFTSGSESLPKGVPLSHRNILANISGALEALTVHADDVLYGFLPPFHSFGMTVCTLLPLVTGLKVVYHPNPNESRKLARGIETWGVTLAAGTPTFLRSILKAGSPSQFQSIRIFLTGAEKAPAELFSLVAALHNQAAVVEGYGITECSPIVTVNTAGAAGKGVGQPLRGTEILIVHPETLEPLPAGQQGLILIRGDSVFGGYLGTIADPFVPVRGQRWYNSGDLGYLDQGNLCITGRLKRFVKIGGEMVSLGAIEEALALRWPSEDGLPNLAIVAKGKEGEVRPALILFSIVSCSIDEVNQGLKDAGFPPLVRISEVRKVDAIPVLGSGKVDLQAVKALA